MNRKQQRIAELIAARDHIDRQIRVLTGDKPATPREPTPAEIRAHAEQIRVTAINQWRDSRTVQEARLHDLNTDADAIGDVRTSRKKTAA